MPTVANRSEFAPPPTPGMLRALGLAIVAHAFLLFALTLGVNWKRDAVTVSAEAELWSAVPQEAAPRLLETPPPSVAAVEKPPQTPAPQADADIAAERDKQRKTAKEKEQQLALEQARQAAEKRRMDKLALDKKRQQDQQAAEDRARLNAKRQEAAKSLDDAKQQEARRQENIKRMAGLAGASGSAASTGTALQASGPSAGYGGRIRARIKPNIVFTDDMAGNPMAEVEVRTAPDGTIIGRKLLKPSGTVSWDEAVLKAIDKTEILPRDVDGRVPPSLVISFRPKD